ncbi:MAG: hypothetical protein ACFNUM_06225, partial [Segatella salivae]
MYINENPRKRIKKNPLEKMSGAVGNLANIPTFVEEYVCRKLGISHAEVSTQVIQRDRHAYYM